MKYKRFVLDVPEEIHEMAKSQAKEMNISLRKYLLSFIYPQVIEREKVMKEKYPYS
jgi:predicted HicB family RNase H-like nuclease